VGGIGGRYFIFNHFVDGQERHPASSPSAILIDEAGRLP